MVRVTKIIRYEYDYEIYTIDNCDYLVYHDNQKYNICLLKNKESFFKLHEEKKVDFFDKISHRDRFHILSFSQINELRQFELKDIYDIKSQYYFNKPPNQEELISALNENRVFSLDGIGYDHLIHSINNDKPPIVPTFKLDYIESSLDNLSLIWENKNEILDRLSKKTCIISVLEKEIPYYNAEKYRDSYLEIKVSLSGDECKTIWDSIKEVDHKTKIGIFQSIIKLRHESFYFKYFDFYNIQEFVRNGDERDKKRTSYDD